MRKLTTMGAAAAILLTGCGGAADDAVSRAEVITEGMDGVTIIPITKANDELGLLDGDDAPTSVAVIQLPGMPCERLTYHSCGAMIETTDEAQEDQLEVSRLTVAMLNDSGQEMWMWVEDGDVLTVSSEVGAGERGLLAAAFDGEPAH